MSLFIDKKKAEYLKGYSIIRTEKFIITLSHGAWNRKSIKHYLEDILEPFITLISGISCIIIFPFKFIKVLWSLLPNLHIIKDIN